MTRARKRGGRGRGGRPKQLRPTEQELAEHLSKMHHIELMPPAAYIPGHRRGHGMRLHQEAHSTGATHTHPWEETPTD